MTQRSDCPPLGHQDQLTIALNWQSVAGTKAGKWRIPDPSPYKRQYQPGVMPQGQVDPPEARIVWIMTF